MKYKLFSLAILAGFLFISSNSFAYDDDDIVYIPDPHFKKMLVEYEHLSVEHGVLDLNHDGEIQYSEAEALHDEFNLGYANDSIKSYEGVRAFTNVIRIFLGYKENVIELDFSGMTGVKLMYINKMPNLKYLNVSNCKNLDNLDTDDCNLITLNLDGCERITGISCSNNQLNEISLKNTNKLGGIRCYNNTLLKLNLNDCTELKFISANDNIFSSIDISNCEKITSLKFINNELLSLDVSNFHFLTHLILDSNKLTRLNIQNENNTRLIDFSTKGNSDLYCITVDDTTWANENMTEKDEWTKFSDDCSVSVIEAKENYIEVFPNPAHNYITIKRNTNEMVDLRILDLNGKIFLSDIIQLGKKQTKLNISQMSAGTYILEIGNQRKLFIIK